MKNNYTEEKVLLDRKGVDHISESIRIWLKRCGVGKQDSLRVWLTMEDQLLNICEHFDEKAEGSFIMGKRYGTPFISFTYKGESFDPTSGDGLAEGMLFNLGLTPHWSYHNGVNKLFLRAPNVSHKSEIMLLIAVVLAVLAGLLKLVIPADVTGAITSYVIAPVSGAFMNVLNTFVRLMVFFSVVTGICSTDSVSDLKSMGGHTVGRMIVRTFLGTALCVVCMIPLFNVGFGTGSGEALQMDKLVELLFSIFPTDPFTPFIQGSMLQIVFMAVIVGAVMLLLSSKVDVLKDIIESLTLLFTQIIELVCKLLPLYIFVSLVELIWDSGSDIFVMLWKPIVICILFCGLLTLGKIIYTGAKFRVSPLMLIRKTNKTMLIGFLTASSSSAFSEVLNVNEKKLGISPKFDRFGLPFANLLCASTTGAAFVIILFYLAEFHHTTADIGWFINMWIMCSVLSMAAPPVSGGMLVVMGILMTQLGIPDSSLAVAALLGIVTDFISTGTRVGIIHCEMVIQADRLNMLDRKILSADN